MNAVLGTSSQSGSEVGHHGLYRCKMVAILRAFFWIISSFSRWEGGTRVNQMGWDNSSFIMATRVSILKPQLDLAKGFHDVESTRGSPDTIVGVRGRR